MLPRTSLHKLYCLLFYILQVYMEDYSYEVS